ncbi:MAG: hypothetical protein ING70_16565 [Rhodocyclaceae bacterium]|jgi:hypothetical protein|nr:hypothetical protein [Rhodocyclaceae bacterium]MCA3147251.1 hypothetical protein [Rhodocyclaceae bacterium]
MDLKLIADSLNSSFTTSLVGALAGAFAGAYAAQKVANRSKVKDQLTSELRHINAAVSISFGVTNTALMAKGQHIKPLRDKYLSEVNRHKEWMERRRTGQIQGNVPYELSMNLTFIPRVFTTIEPLKSLVFTSVQASSKVVNLLLSLEDYLQQLDRSIENRHRMINEFKERRFPAGAEEVHIYLGLPFGDGHRSVEYGATLDAMSQYVDDVIFYSSELAKELSARGKEVQARYRRLFNDPPPEVSSIDLSIAKERGLLPPAERYEDWLSAFRKTDERIAWWQRDA